jgi:hypothetical protein
MGKSEASLLSKKVVVKKGLENPRNKGLDGMRFQRR